ncbi:unnamed protein product [Cochlearia groenlandica]
MVGFTPRNAKELFSDFKGRRSGIIKALSTDFRKLYNQCDPNKENLSLYGLPNGSWDVHPPPPDDTFQEFPEPALGINFSRDGMEGRDWIRLIAFHSDSWLISLAFYYAARLKFSKNDREKFFDLINELPTVYEVITGKATQSEEEDDNHESSESGDEDEEEGAVCGTCGENNGVEDEFWICCDACDKWFHGECVKMTPAKAKCVRHYLCPSCSNNKKLKAYCDRKDKVFRGEPKQTGHGF